MQYLNGSIESTTMDNKQTNPTLPGAVARIGNIYTCIRAPLYLEKRYPLLCGKNMIEPELRIPTMECALKSQATKLQLIHILQNC